MQTQTNAEGPKRTWALHMTHWRRPPIGCGIVRVVSRIKCFQHMHSFSSEVRHGLASAVEGRVLHNCPAQGKLAA